MARNRDVAKQRKRQARAKRLQRARNVRRNLPGVEPALGPPDAPPSPLARERHARYRELVESGAEYGSREEAQDLAFDALQAEDDEEALRLARIALEHDPQCGDAQVLVARYELEAGPRAEHLVAIAERQATELGGPAFFEAVGPRFWEAFRTRPYMRTLHALVEAQLEGDDRPGARETCELCLQLNPVDHHGVRYHLAALYLRDGQTDEAGALLERYEGRVDPLFRPAAVLERFLAGEREDAAQLAREMDAGLPGLRERLLDASRAAEVPELEGLETAADHAHAFFAAAWRAQPDALAWLGALA